MATVNSVSQQANSALLATLNGSSASATTSSSQTSAQSINDTFLKLLVAQMNNQDPLNPMDNAQVTTQMAQISTVTGINNLSTSFGQMLTQFSSLQALQAAQLTGRSALVTGNVLTAGAGAGTGGVQLSAPADQVAITISDANGQVVRTLNLGPQGQGIQTFTWDGLDDSGKQVAAGSYSISAKASAGGQDVAVDTLSAARIDGVRMNGTDLQLIVAGIGPVAYSDIKQIL
jgi:flagellar basal-body rod modification protein FlgD